MREKIFFLDKNSLSFPDPLKGSKDSPIAIGGDLNPERIILAYKNGIFPWYSDYYPILWWSPDPRFILIPENIHISHSLQKKLKKEYFDLTCDQSFEEVISLCAKSKRKYGDGTWITKEMEKAYIELFKSGFAHSIETRKDGKLVGGFYGVCLGSVFFGESMFHIEKDASKFAFAKFVRTLKVKTNIDLIDCQVYTDYLASFGAQLIPRVVYINLLKERINKDNGIKDWTKLF